MRILQVIFFIFLMGIFTLNDLGFIAYITAGIPSYDSLDLLQGQISNVKKCTAVRHSELPIEVYSSSTVKKLYLPCTSELKALKDHVGENIEIRTRLFSGYIFNTPVPEVWSVKLGGAELYSYQARVGRSSATRSYFFAILSLVLHGGTAIYLVKSWRKDATNEKQMAV